MATRGGVRENSGRKPGSTNKPKDDQAIYEIAADAHQNDPEKFLESIMAGNHIDLRFRMDAAKMLLSYTKPKAAKPTKKEEQAEKAKATSGKFAKTRPPRS